MDILRRLDSKKAGRLIKHGTRTFKPRWAAVNAAERQELAATPIAQKFSQSEALLESARYLGWTESPAENGGGVGKRWARLSRIFYC